MAYSSSKKDVQAAEDLAKEIEALHPKLKDQTDVWERNDGELELSLFVELPALRKTKKHPAREEYMLSLGVVGAPRAEGIGKAWNRNRYMTDEGGVESPFRTFEDAALNLKKIVLTHFYGQKEAMKRMRASAPNSDYKANLPGGRARSNPTRNDPTILKRMVVRIAEKDGDVGKAFGIATSQLQRMGYLKKGTRELSIKGHEKENSYTREQEQEAEESLRRLLGKGAPRTSPSKAPAKSKRTTKSPARPRGREITPMLAQVYSGLKPGRRYVAEPKIDGYRLTATKTPSGVVFETRPAAGKKHGNTEPYTSNLRDLGKRIGKILKTGDVLDGEIYVDSYEGTGIVRSDPPTAEQQRDIDRKATFWAFDMPSVPGPYRERRKALERIVKGTGTLRTTPVIEVRTDAQVKKIAKKLFEWGFEGAMVKDVDAEYSPGKRTSAFLKVKFRHDITAKIVGFERGTGKYANSLGALRVTAQGKTFKVGTGLSDKQRDAIWRNQHAYKGRSIEVTAQKDGAKLRLPRFPAFVRFRGEE